MWETDTNTLVFASFDDYLNPDDDYGLYYGFNYAVVSNRVTAASVVEDLHLYFARLEGPAAVLAWMAVGSFLGQRFHGNSAGEEIEMLFVPGNNLVRAAPLRGDAMQGIINARPGMPQIGHALQRFQV